MSKYYVEVMRKRDLKTLGTYEVEAGDEEEAEFKGMSEARRQHPEIAGQDLFAEVSQVK